MNLRRSAFALIVLLVAVAAWSIHALTPRPREVASAPVVLSAPVTPARSESFTSSAPEARTPQSLDFRAEPPTPAAPDGAHAALAVERSIAEAVAALVAELERLDADRPVTFHVDATSVVVAFVTAEIVRVAGSEAVAEALEAELDSRRHASRVGGVLLTTLGGIGGPEPLLARLSPGDPERLRGATAGLAWSAAEAAGTDAVPLRPAEFLQLQPHGGLAMLDLAWNRLPAEREDVWLTEQARVPAEDLAALLQRELCVMALGLAADTRPEMLEQLRVWLMDREPATQQLRPVIVYVLAKARSVEARAVLQRFLEDEQVGDYGKLLARWWLSKQPAMEGDLKLLAAPLMDRHSAPEDRVMAAGALLGRLEGASESDLRQLEELLALRVLQEEHGAARTSALVALNAIPGGFQRLGALDRVVRGESDWRQRRIAASGLAYTTGPYRNEALSMLRAALSYEQDPGLKQYIHQLLVEAEQ